VSPLCSPRLTRRRPRAGRAGARGGEGEEQGDAPEAEEPGQARLRTEWARRGVPVGGAARGRAAEAPRGCAQSDALREELQLSQAEVARLASLEASRGGAEGAGGAEATAARGEQMDAALAASREETREAVARLAAADEEAHKHRTEAERLSGVMARLKDELDQAVENADVLRGDLEASEKRGEQLRAEVEDLRAQGEAQTSADEEATQLRSELAAAAAALAEERAAVARLEQEGRAMQEQVRPAS